MRSGKELQSEKEGTSGVVGEEKVVAENYQPSEVEDVTPEESVKEQEKEKNKTPPVKPYKSTIPYLERLRKNRDQE